MKKLKILVTGANGALGKILIQKIQDVQFEYLATVRNDLADKMSSKVVKCDITEIDNVKSVVNEFKPNVIVHLAGLTGNIECETNPRDAFILNVLGTYNVLQAAIKTKPKIIFASSREVYGNTEKKIKENDPLEPINVNGRTKMISENLILNFHSLYKIPYEILRFTNFYGENCEKRGISAMIKKAIEEKHISIFGGKQSLDLLYFEDAANAIIKAIKHKKSDIFNIGNGNSITPLLLLKKIEKIGARKIPFEVLPYRDFEVKKFSIDLTKSRRILKFQATYNLDMVLSKMFKKWTTKMN